MSRLRGCAGTLPGAFFTPLQVFDAAVYGSKTGERL